jgi:ribosomal protein S18 acetylase RimI-like enzyme
VTIRVATTRDAEAVARVHVDSWRWAYRGIMPDEILDGMTVELRTERWQKILTSNGIPSTTWVTDPVTGFVSRGPSRDDDAHGEDELWALYVAPAVAGTGVGRALLEHVLDGVKEMTLWVLAGNARAIRFYEKAGFRDDKRSKDDPAGEHVRYRYIARPPSTSIVLPLK